jgi:hypothetical protein
MMIMDDKRMAGLLLTASLQMREGISQTVVILQRTAKAMPEYSGIAENYITINSELEKAIETLKGMF